MNKSQSCCLGSKGFTGGKHYWTLLIEPLQCCVHAGVIDCAKNASELCLEEFWKLWEKLGEEPHDKFPGPTVLAGFLLDQEKHTLRITDHNSQSVLEEYPVKNAVLHPVVMFKH